jgi:hypothetical protein
MIDPGLLQLCQFAVFGQAFNRLNLFAHGDTHRQDARANGCAIHHDRTGATLRDAATVLCAGQADLLSNDPQEWGIWIDIHAMRFAVYGQLNRHRETPEN